MTTSEQRLMILRMVEEGKITAEEGARLLAAVDDGEEGVPTEPTQRSSLTASRIFRVRVSDLVTGQQKVGVNIPVGLVGLGLRFVPDSAGVDVQAIRDAIDSGMVGNIVDVTDEEDGKRVEITIE